LEHDVQSGSRDLAHRLVRGFGLLVLAALVVWYAATVLLYAFAGLLLAIFLCACTDFVKKHTRLGRGLSYALVVAALIGGIFTVGWFLVPRVVAQLNELVTELPKSLAEARRLLERSEWGRFVLDRVTRAIQNFEMVGSAAALVTRVVEAAAGLVVVLIAGLYFAASPDDYRSGLERLLPHGSRRRMSEVFDEVGYTLRWWILGQCVPMVALGIATMIGLWLLGAPLAFTLGLFTGAMIFIPYLGSIISMLFAMLIALSQGPMQSLYVGILYIGVHSAEGYVLTPLVQRRAVLLPPALNILAQVFLGLLMGFPGLALATPLTAAGLAVIKMLYLGEQPDHD
jgi:predicted PurR-regulated permease PerM